MNFQNSQKTNLSSSVWGHYLPTVIKLFPVILLCTLFLVRQGEVSTVLSQDSNDSNRVYLPLINTPLGDEPVGSGEDELLPTDFADLLEYNVDKGVWSYTEGVIEILRFLTGEIERATIPNVDTLITGELNTFIKAVDRHVLTLGESEDKSRIGQLRGQFLPDLSNIDDYSEESMTSSNSLREPSIPGTPAQCKNLWKTQYPKPGSAANLICYESVRQNFIAPDSTQSAAFSYFPITWEHESDYANRVALTTDAISKSVSQFDDYKGASLGKIVVVFSPLRKDSKGTLAATTSPSPFTCTIVIYEAAVTQMQKNPDQYQQTVAHEIFHCFQFLALRAQVNGPSGEAEDWWVEGTAEYFSNVIFPRANDEYMWAEEFRTLSMNTAITDKKMTYETFLFWQYLGNSMGNEGVIDMLTQMPITGDSNTQARTLASMGNGNMDTLFHQFAQTYLDHSIRDTDGGVHYNDPTKELNATYKFNKSKSPLVKGRVNHFSIPRIGLTYEEKLFFEQKLTVKNDMQNSVRELDTPGSWMPLPDDVSACSEEVEYLWLATTTNVDVAEIVSLDVEKGDPERCTCFVELKVDHRTYFSSAAGYQDLAAPILPAEVNGGDPLDFTLRLLLNDITQLGEQPTTLLTVQDADFNLGYVDGETGQATVELTEIIDHYIGGKVEGKMLWTPAANPVEQIVPFTLDFRAGQVGVPGVCAEP